MSKNNVRRPQAPKRRNFVAKNVGKVHRPQTFRDRTKYDRYEDYLSDQLQDYVDDDDDLDEEVEAQRLAEFKAKLAGEKWDPDLKEEWSEYLFKQDMPDDPDWDDFDYDEDPIDFDYNGYDDEFDH